MRRARLLPLLPLCLAACTQFPELDGATSARAEAADYPALVPLEPLLANRRSAAAPPPAADAESRVTALRARAARLRSRPVIDSATRRRMARGAG
ncbi:MAG: hypothetical protein AAFY38_10320 [Pseudomonadota bacterium]